MKIISPEKFKSLPNGILFDTDNTLYHYEPAHNEGMQAVRKKATELFSITEKQFGSAFESARNDIKGNLCGTASSHSRLLYFQRLLEHLGLGSQVLLALDFEQTYWRTFLSGAILFDGVKVVLETARLLGIPTAVVTDLTAQIQFRKLVYFELDQFFDFVITSEEAGYDKPHEAPFKLALEKMKLNSSDSVWMIGDNPKNDIFGARNTIGATTLQKVHENIREGVGEERPDLSFFDFSDIANLLKSLDNE